uniref:Uncharacterized protein n=1 Tax=Nitratidesulfovibrio vulgaris (strain DSM 19637 / Miyazaki F) TaxID=883 RepID=B8DLI2_NITV9
MDINDLKKSSDEEIRSRAKNIDGLGSISCGRMSFSFLKSIKEFSQYDNGSHREFVNSALFFLHIYSIGDDGGVKELTSAEIRNLSDGDIIKIYNFLILDRCGAGLSLNSASSIPDLANELKRALKTTNLPYLDASSILSDKTKALFDHNERISGLLKTALGSSGNELTTALNRINELSGLRYASTAAEKAALSISQKSAFLPRGSYEIPKNVTIPHIENPIHDLKKSLSNDLKKVIASFEVIRDIQIGLNDIVRSAANDFAVAQSNTNKSTKTMLWVASITLAANILSLFIAYLAFTSPGNNGDVQSEKISNSTTISQPFEANKRKEHRDQSVEPARAYKDKVPPK